MRIHALLPGTKSNRKKLNVFSSSHFLTEPFRNGSLFNGSFSVIKISLNRIAFLLKLK